MMSAVFDEYGSYTSSWSAVCVKSIAEDGDWWNELSSAYQWVMSEMGHKGMPRPDPDAAPLWAWVRWVDSKGRARTRPDRRYPGFRNQYDGLELLHLQVDENRVLCTDFDQYHCVINRWPCAPLDADRWPPAECDRWLDEHWDDPADMKAVQYRKNAIVDPKRLPDRWIQACLWTVTPEDVFDVRRACGKPDTIGNLDDLRSRAARFAESWAGRGDEKSETQQYWRDLLDKVLLISDTSDGQTLWFERRTALGGFIDALMIQARVLVEQKSLGVDLDKPEPRRGSMVTPVRQAKRYADGTRIAAVIWRVPD